MPKLRKDGLDDQALRAADEALATIRRIRRAEALGLACHLFLASGLSMLLASASGLFTQSLPWLQPLVGAAGVASAAGIATATASLERAPDDVALHTHAKALRQYALILAAIGIANLHFGLPR